MIYPWINLLSVLAIFQREKVSVQIVFEVYYSSIQKIRMHQFAVTLCSTSSFIRFGRFLFIHLFIFHSLLILKFLACSSDSYVYRWTIQFLSHWQFNIEEIQEFLSLSCTVFWVFLKDIDYVVGNKTANKHAKHSRVLIFITGSYPTKVHEVSFSVWTLVYTLIFIFWTLFDRTIWCSVCH